MSFEFSRDYFALAVVLIDDPTEEPGMSEARLRSAVSRAYYAAFHGARRNLIDLQREIAPSIAPNLFGSGSHERVWDRYKRAGRALAKIGNLGFQLKDVRRRADYEPQPVTRERAQQTVDDARKLLRLLGTLAASDIQTLVQQLSREPF